MRYLEFHPEELTHDLWESYFENREQLYRESNPRDPLPSRELRREYMLDPHPDYDVSWWFVLDDDADIVRGTGGIWWTKPQMPNYDSYKEYINLSMRLERSTRSKEVRTAFLKILLEKIEKIGKLIVRVECDHEDQFAFWSELKGEVKAERAESRLYMEDADWHLMQKWNDEGPRNAPRVRIEVFNDIPAADLEEFCLLYTETFNQAPAGDVPAEVVVTPEKRREYEGYFKKQGYEWTTMITREEDGAISGLTEIFHRAQEPFRIEQELTGVQEKYRGRGLGKWLKSEMILFIKKEYPNALYITTGNNDSNAPMLSINDRMGFRVHKKQRFYEFDNPNISRI